MTPKQQLFVREYLVDLNATQAAIRAGLKQPQVQGPRLLDNVAVRQAIEEANAKRLGKVQRKAEAVIEKLWDIAAADAGDLVEYRRTCCRNCWGINHGYQHTPREMAAARRAYEERLADARKEGKELAAFDELGGVGYDARKDPHPDCPECFGEGIGEVFVKDTRHLPAHVRALYAGVKRTKDGIEVKMHPVDKALELLGRHYKLFTDKVEHSGAVSITAVTGLPDADDPSP